MTSEHGNTGCATVDSTLISGLHGRQRRVERNIEKIDLQRARRYGMKEKGKNGRLKYTYGGIVFIYDPYSNKEVTSFPSRDEVGTTTGTCHSKPVELEKYSWNNDCHKVIEEVTSHVIDAKLAKFFHSNQLYSRCSVKYTSHSILIVDMSGSMRRDDVNGARCRSDGVWMALARDYIKIPLERKQRTENRKYHTHER